MSATDLPMPGNRVAGSTVIASSYDETDYEGIWLMLFQPDGPPYYQVVHIDRTKPEVTETTEYRNIIDAADKWREETQ